MFFQKKNKIIGFFVLVAAVFMAACSTKNNTAINRTYHNVTAKYNVYFNGNEAFKKGVKTLDKTYIDNYTQILPMFKYGEKNFLGAISGDMDRAIIKSSKLIKKHSITAKPKKKKAKKRKKLSKKEKKFLRKPEYCKWVDDAYLLMGKAALHKQDFKPAIKSFEYIIKTFKKEPIKFDATIWLIRTYNEMEKFDDSQRLLGVLSNDRKFPEKLQGELAAIYADFYLKQKEYERSLPHLEKAIELAKKKKTRLRYMYILAQIYQKLENFNKASQLFTDVIDKNPPYEMAFNAKINRAGSFSGGGNSNEIRKQLFKMLKDDKNIDFQDQIYFALANLALREGKNDEAIKNFKLSVRKSVSNQNQKAISFLALADLYFEKPNYRLAGFYYDSTMTYLSQSHTDYDELALKTKKLKNLIKNLSLIEREDSLQALARMTEGERNQVINKAIESENRKKQEAKQLIMNQQNMYSQSRMDQMDMQRQGSRGSGFYFYNPNLLSFGHTNFLKKWGERRLEDNWRRINKAVTTVAMDEENENSDESGEIDRTKREYYLKNIPFSDSAKVVSTAKIMEAMYNVGVIYEHDFSNHDEAILAFLKLNKRFPDSFYELESFYQLYLVNKTISNSKQKNFYKKQIIKQYPESKYAKMFTNPNYVKELQREEQLLENLYVSTYNSFKSGNYSAVAANVKRAEAQYPKNKLAAKFDLLNTMSLAHTASVSGYKKALEKLKETYANDTEIQKKVNELLEAIKRGNYTEKEIYFYNQPMQHHYLFYLNNPDVDINSIKFKLANYNADTYNDRKFEMQIIPYTANNQIVIVKNFANKEDAEAYFQALQASDIFKEIPAATFKECIIAFDNFEIFKKNKQFERYWSFFKKYYLKK